MINKKLLFSAFFYIFCLLQFYGNIIVVGPLTHEKETGPGVEYTGTIVLRNIAQEPKEVKVYQTDYFFYSDGRILYTDPGQLERSNADWITFSPARMTIPGNETVTVYYTVKVPGEAGQTGTFWSILMVEGIEKGSPEGTDPEEVNMGVRQVFRYGIQVVSHMENTGTRTLQFTSTKLLKEEGVTKIQLDVQNTGQRWLRAELWAEVYDQKGKFQGKFPAEKQRLYPETSRRFIVALEGLAPGKYKTSVIVDCGNDDVFGANYNIVINE